MNHILKPVAAIVVAAGSGSRLGYPIPKALVGLGGVPLVVRALRALRSGGADSIVVVAPETHLDEFRALCEPEGAIVVVGGAERQDSVRLGLAAAGDAQIVLVHDAARPLVPADVVQRVIQAVAGGARAVVPAVPVVDSIRDVSGNSSVTVDRATLRAIQTPQGFDAALLRRAHEHVEAEGLAVTDDAAACEALGESITLVEGSREAMKITEPIDLVIAESIIAKE